MGLEASGAVEALSRGQAPSVSYYTVSNDAYFLGTVALLNSLRVTGNEGELVVLDAGLAPARRAALEGHAKIVSIPDDRGHAWLLKPFPHLLGVEGVVVMIDSDIIVTAPLAPLTSLAGEGKICVYPAWTTAARRRWFPEWEEMLQLREPLRRQEWVHDGVVIFDTSRWGELLQRWWEVCGRGRSEEMSTSGWGFNGDADALNALLMSEFPQQALEVLPHGEEVFAGDVAVDDLESLVCRVAGERVRVIHVPDRPKPWEPLGWSRRGGVTYLQLMRRLLFSSDVPVRLRPEDVPLWLRPGPGGRLALSVLGGLSSVLLRLARAVPPSAGERLRRLRRKVA